MSSDQIFIVVLALIVMSPVLIPMSMNVIVFVFGVIAVLLGAIVFIVFEAIPSVISRIANWVAGREGRQ